MSNMVDDQFGKRPSSKIRLWRRTIIKTALLGPISARLMTAGSSGTLSTLVAGIASARAREPSYNNTTGHRITPIEMEAVTLLPSVYLDADRVNSRYLMSIDPDRLLHGYRVQAGLPPKAEGYGGWEADTIAGHSLGHYLTALSLMSAQGDSQGEDHKAAKRRVGYIVEELAHCQAQSQDGYLAAFTRRYDGRVEPGRLIFEEIARGNIRVRPFNLNGGWAPLYNWHKLLAGLLDADRLCHDQHALVVAERLAGFIEAVFAPLDDATTQTVLGCEYGGLNESMIELHSRSGNVRWRRLAERLNDRASFGKLQDGAGNLDGLHANALLAKVVGQARLFEVTGDSRYRVACETMWRSVTGHYDYVIGGTGEHEYFPPSDSMGRHITDRTCETCATYNMLKLTRHLHGWAPDARYFDYYEMAHLNHILAQQHPTSGMFTYMMPLSAGSRREYSDPTNDFWCCVGTGMESHAKHGDSIWWHRSGSELFINLFIPSKVFWAEREAHLTMDTAYPYSGLVDITFDSADDSNPFTLALRIPGWSSGFHLSVNGERMEVLAEADGYARLTRKWLSGDKIQLDLAMSVRVVRNSGDRHQVSLFHGPLLLAADLGPADLVFTKGRMAPILVAENPLKLVECRDTAALTYDMPDIHTAGSLTLRPFTFLHDRCCAPTFSCYTPKEWDDAGRPVQAMTSAAVFEHDVVIPGDVASERAHGLDVKAFESIRYRTRSGWLPVEDGSLEARMASAAGPLALRVTYYDDDVCRLFQVLVDDQVIAEESLPGRNPGVFYDKIYRLPPSANYQKLISVRFVAVGERGVGRIFGIGLRAASA